jgi:hypothetical protein
VNSFTCACAAGYSGATCATNINDCAPNPCLNGGACTDGVNSFTCACTGGFTGTTCSVAPGSVKILLDCGANSNVLNTFTGTGCFSPIAPGGASYAILAPGTPQITAWSGANCTGCKLVITANLNFCSASFPTCGGLNDNVQSISIP